MPLKNGKFPPYCINHPDKKMALNNDHNADFVVISFFGREVSKQSYDVPGRCAATNLYCCEICGYCEQYFIPPEMEQLKASVIPPVR